MSESSDLGVLYTEPPTVFFRPHDDVMGHKRVRLRGRPGEWYASDDATDSRGVDAATS